MQPAPQRTHLALALFALWVLWGSTYLSIGVAVRSIPPFTMAGLRFLLAGTAFALWLLARKQTHGLRQRRVWLGGLGSGFALVLCSNGLVSWASMALSSSVVALLVATVPLWMAVFEHLRGTRQGPLVWLGVLLGLAGVATMVWPQDGQWLLHGGSVVALMVATITWSAGSLWSRGAMQGCDPLAFATAQMLCGGALQLACGGALGEWTAWDPARVPTAGWGNLVYLAVAGSLLGFSAYLWLLRNTTSAVAASYAFVNPLVALLLAVTIGDEVLMARTWPAGALILAAVACVLRERALATRAKNGESRTT